MRAAEDGKLGLRTVCIDAGHGGHDPGTISKDKMRTQEKALALDIALRLRDKIQASYPEVKVVMTRSDDTFIPLAERAAIANRAGADLFISVHINSAANTSASGYSIHVLGQSSDKNKDVFKGNLELTRRENEVITLENDYSTTYQGYDPSNPESFILFNLMQNAHLEQSLEFADHVNNALKGSSPKSRGVSQNNFLVLWRTTMPAVLIECGFITNSSDLALLRGEKGREHIAEGIFQGFKSFKKQYDSSLSVGRAADSSAGEVSGSKDQEATDGLFGTQILASGKLLPASDPFFKGYTPVIVKGARLNRYVVGTAPTLEQAKALNKEIKKKFPDSWLVKITGDTTERVQ